MDNLDSITFHLHYYLTDNNLHSMNAKVHNECAKQFIQAIILLNKYIDEPIELEVFAIEEGGVKDFYKVIIKNPLILIIITALITSSINQFFTSNFSPKISITEKSKNKLENLLKIKEAIKTGNLSKEEFDYIAENDKDLKKLKSNFFKSAKKEKRIDFIEIEALQKDRIPLFDKKSINSSDFDKCITPDEQLTSDTNIDAKIFIVAPVLLRGRKDHWKGIYNDQPIEFSVCDKVFLENVFNHIIKFSNGTYIDCNMKVSKTRSSIDETEKISRKIINVSSYGDEEKFSTIYKKKKRVNLDSHDEQSPTLFSETD